MQKKLESLLKKQIWKRIVATMLVFTLTIVNFILLGIAAIGTVSYAAGNLELQNSSTQHENVKFDAYFVRDSQKVHSSILDISESTGLFVYLNVKDEGFLKNANIEVKNPNYEITGELEGSDVIDSINENNILLKQINYRYRSYCEFTNWS